MLSRTHAFVAGVARVGTYGKCVMILVGWKFGYLDLCFPLFIIASYAFSYILDQLMEFEVSCVSREIGLVKHARVSSLLHPHST